MRRKFSSRRSKPLRPGALPRVTGPPDGVGPFLSDGAARRRGPERWIGSTEPETVSPPGAMRSKPINTARGTPRDLADLRLFGLQRASSLRGIEVRGSSGTGCVPRALDSFRCGGNFPEHDPEKWEPVFGKDRAQTKDRRPPRRAQTTGAAERCLPRRSAEREGGALPNRPL